MRFSGTVEIAAPRQQVWDFLMDPRNVAPCGPGYESIEMIDETHFRVVAKVGIGYISSRFSINMQIAEAEPVERALLTGSGQAPGSAVDGSAEMKLSGPPEGPTTMDWSAEVRIAGKLASVGARLIEGTANKMIAQTFDCIRVKIAA